MIDIITGTLGDTTFNKQHAADMFRLRYRVFHEQLGWDVSTCREMEFDRYDNADTHYQIARSASGIDGCWRLRSTSTPFMLDEVFPELCDSRPPSSRNVWEISRFATRNSAYKNPSRGFGLTSLALMEAALDFALENEIEAYLMVTSTALERIGARLGYPTRRLGPPKRIGNVTAIALELPVTEVTARCARLFSRVTTQDQAA